MRRKLSDICHLAIFTLLWVLLTACSASKSISSAGSGTQSEEIPFAEEGEVRQPTFQGKDKNHFRAWVSEQLVYPPEDAKNRVQGRVTARFIIERDGQISNIEILRAPSLAMSRQVIRILRSSPAWEPGIKDGEPARVRITLPVDFKLK